MKIKIFMFNDMERGQNMVDRWLKENPSIHDMTMELASNKWNICLVISYKE